MITQFLSDQAKNAADLIRNADALIIGAGAGMSVDSGLPDFRGGEGLWNAYPKLKHLNLSFQDMANPKKFKGDPSLSWGWYGHRLIDYRSHEPHDGFRMLLEIVKLKNDNARVYTSNIDGHFQKSGWDEYKVYECHGSIHHLQCTNKCTLDIWSADDFQPEVDLTTCELTNEFPTCPNCGRISRPNVLMFDDYDFAATRTDMKMDMFYSWLRDQKNVVAIEIGAGTAIPTVRQACDYRATNVIRINPLHTHVSKPGDVSIPTGGLDGIKLIYDELMKEKQ